MSKVKKDENQVEYTGRYLVLMPENTDTGVSALGTLNSISGLNLKSSTEFENEVFTTKDLDSCDGILLENIGVAIVNKNPNFEVGIGTMTEDHNMIVEKERVVYAIDKLNPEAKNYMHGYRDAVNVLSEMLLGDAETDTIMAEDEGINAAAVGATWGLKATKVVPSSLLFSNPYSGVNVKVAILDTGFDFNHPDFVGRPIVQRSFIPGEATQDLHGHGTHCTGTACGPINPPGNIERYGIAHKANIYIGKVLSNAGSGTDGQILAGINWAQGQGCKVISMSLGGRVTGAGFSAIYENTALNLLNRGTLIVAAAGNDSNRPGQINPVSHPANCPSIMAVGAVDAQMNVARFSNGGLFLAYGAVDIVGPGVGVFSSVSTPHSPNMGPLGIQRGNANGTSMAAPHVAGIAALWIEASSLTGRALWSKLLSTAKPLPQHPTRDVGAGLVQAPNKRRLPVRWPAPF